MQRRTLLVLPLLLTVAGLSTWYISTLTYPQPHITCDTHAWASPATYDKVHTQLAENLSHTYDLARASERLQQQLPCISGITAHRTMPKHVHSRITMDTPQALINANSTAYIMTANGTCIPQQYYADAAYQQVPQITWKSDTMPSDVKAELHTFINHLPSTWWSKYQCVWHDKHDIRLLSDNPDHKPHLRMTADTQISPQREHQIQYIHTHMPRTTRWIDMRCTGRAIACPKLRGSEQ